MLASQKRKRPLVEEEDLSNYKGSKDDKSDAKGAKGAKGNTASAVTQSSLVAPSDSMLVVVTSSKKAPRTPSSSTTKLAGAKARKVVRTVDNKDP